MQKRKILRVASYVTISVIAIVIAAAIIVNFYFNHKIIDRLQAQITKVTNGEYALSVDGLSINLLSRSITVKNLIVAPTGKIGKFNKAHYVFKAKSLKILDFEYIPYLQDHDLNVNSILFDEPQISIFQGSERYNKIDKDTTAVKFSLYKILSAQLNSFSVKNIDITNSKFNIYKNGTDTLAVFSAAENSFSIKNFLVNKTTDEMDRLFFADKFDVVMNKFTYHLGNGLYTVFGKSLYASYTDSTLIIDSLQLVPDFDRKEFAAEAEQQISRVKINSAQVSFEGFNVKLFFEYNWLISKKLLLEGFHIDVYRDNTVPLKPIRRPSLQALLHDAPIFISIDSVMLKDAEVTFESLEKGATGLSKTTVSKLNVSITGINTDTTMYTDKSKVRATLSGYFMSKGKFVANSEFPLNTRLESFHFAGHLFAIPISYLNPLVANAKHISFKTGQVQSMDFDFTAGEKEANGTMKLLYNGLTVDVLNVEGKEKTFKDKVKTWLANSVVVKESNPDKSGVTRITPLHAERNPYRFFLYYTMATLASGLGPAIEGEETASLLKRMSKNKNKK